MLTRALVVSITPYQDKHAIVRCYTSLDGLKSYYVRNVYGSKRSQQKSVYFQPLTLLELEVNHKNKDTLEYFKEVNLLHPYQTLHSDVVKVCVVMLLAEVLAMVLADSAADEELYCYIERQLQWYDKQEQCANFLIFFLIDLTKYLGFYPTHLEQGTYFDFQEGWFVEHPSTQSLNKVESELFKRLLTIDYDSPNEVFTNHNRRQLLQILMQYYTWHIDGFREPRSLEVVKEIF